MSERPQYVDIPPAVREQAQALFNQASAVYRVLGNFMAPPQNVKAAKRALVQLRADALALSKEL